MADTQNQILVEDFTTQLDLEAQQSTSFFRGRILEAPVRGRLFEHQVLGGTEMDEINGRNQSIVLGDPDHQRRGALIQGFYKALPIDNDDQLKSLVDIKSGYARSIAQGAMRKLDKIVAEAAIGSILTGQQFTTTTTAANDGVSTVTAGSGITYEKLLETRKTLNSKGVGLMGEKMYFACTDVQAESLLQEIEVISSDYNRAEAARTGFLPEIAGFNIIVFPSDPITGSSIINKVSTTRECFAFSEDALKLGMLSDFEVRFERRPDLVDTHQLVITSRYAALRTQGEKVVQVDVTE